MPAVDILVSSPVTRTPRTRQLESIFDCPPQQKVEKRWRVNLPVDDNQWRIGAITGPSGCGKSQIARRLWPEQFAAELSWTAQPAIEDFDARLSIRQCADACMAVGFNNLPSWLAPYAVLSQGEKFRVELARRLAESGLAGSGLSGSGGLVVFDEFTSVVNRQVARAASHAVQKFVRRSEGLRLVTVSCHDDILDWLQPDWVYNPATDHFARDCLRRRPPQQCVVGPVDRSAWRLFAPFHYLSSVLHVSARCYGLWLDGTLAAFCAVMRRPGRRGFPPLYTVHRVVVLPDYQGLGLAFHLMNTIGACHSGIGNRLTISTAHPGFIRSLDRSPQWRTAHKPRFQKRSHHPELRHLRQAARMTSSFRYIGPADKSPAAQRVLQGNSKADIAACRRMMRRRGDSM